MSANVPCATDVGVSGALGDNVQVLPCCQVWRKKYTKAEKGRNLLRQGVDLLQTKLDQLYNENVNLKKANEKGQAGANMEKDGKEIELATRESLEKETFALKCEISALKQREVASAQERNEEIEVLQARVFDREKEIGRLKELLEKEKIRADSEKKNAAVERKKAAEALKRLESEKGKADKERRANSLERKKVEDYKLQLEVLNNEFQKANSNFITEMSKFDEARRELEAERLKSTEERKRADLQMLKAEEHRRLAEANMKKAFDETLHVESLSKQLEDARRRIEELNKERNVLSLPIVSPEVFSDQQHAKRIQPEPTNGKKQADPEMKDSYEKDTSVEMAKTKHLRKQIKLGKQKLKHVKEVAKLESVRTSSMYQELCCMKLDLAQVYQRLDVMDKCLQSPAGDFVEKSEDMVSFQMLKRKEKLRNLTSSQTYLQDDEQLLTGNCMETCQHSSPLNAMFKESCDKSSLGTDSMLESLRGVANQKMLLNSAINSRAASFSDRLSVGMSTPGDDNLNGLLTISDLSAAVVSERSLSKNMGFVSENNVRSPLPTDAGTEVSARSRKRKRISDAIDYSIELSCSGIKKLFMHVEDNISILRRMANRRSKSSKGGKLTQSYSQAKHDGSRKKRRKLHDMNVAMPLFNDGGQPKQMEKLDIAVQGDADDPTNGAKVHLFDSVSTDANLKDVVDGDYMKLLDLDHADDEKSYRMAMEVPLSPNLPNVKLPGPESCDTDNLGPIIDESGYSNGKKSFTSSGNFDIIDMEFDYNMLKHCKPEIVMSILVKELIAQSGIMIHQDLMVNSSYSTILLREDKFGQISGCEEVSCVLKMYYDASQSGSCAKNTMCHITDVLSWVELLASKMNWNWVCNETIRPLLRMLDSPLTEDLTLSIIILLGQLGRLGVDAVGYEDREMEKLRSQLSAFLWRDSTIRAGLPTQIATLSAILGLIPLDIENVIIKDDTQDITTTRQSSPVHLLRNWFHSLSEEEQALSISLLKFPVRS